MLIVEPTAEICIKLYNWDSLMQCTQAKIAFIDLQNVGYFV